MKTCPRCGKNKPSRLFCPFCPLCMKCCAEMQAETKGGEG